MRARARNLLVAGLSAAAVLAAGTAAVLSDRAGDEASRDAAGVRAAAELDRAFRRFAERLDALADEAGTRFLDVTDPPDTAKGRASTAKGLERLRPLLDGAGAPAGSRLAVYERLEDAGNDDVRPVGWVTAATIGRDGLEAWPGRVPAGLLGAEERRTASSASPSSLVWFSFEEGRVLAHLLSTYSHTYEHPDEGRDPVEAIRFVEVCAPFGVPDGLSAWVRCDLDAGALTHDLPERRVGPDLPGSAVEATALRPKDLALRFPDASDAPRARVRAPAPAPAHGGATILLLGGAFGAGLAAAVLARPGRRGPAAEAPDVVAEAAHELKTPLTSMRGTLEVALRRERTPEEYRDTMAATLEDVKGLQHLVGSVLLLARGLDGPRVEEPVDLVEVARAEAERLHASRPERRVALALSRGPGVVLGDPSLLARAVGNLLDNAAFHSVAGGEIRVRAEVVAGAVRVVVEDEGPGIPEHRREKIFERFYRGPEVGQRGIPGSGLGLPIARWIAQLHGGTLILDPAAATRARFVLEVPLAKPGAALRAEG